MIDATILALAILSQPAPIPMTYGVAECSGWPLTAGQLSDDGIKVLGVHQSTGRVMVRLLHVASKRRAHMVAFKLGSRETGWTVWSIRAPTRIAALIAASPLCRVTATYQQVLSWPQAARDWLAERSTCYGAATWRGQSYAVWPCIWSTERSGEGSVSSLAGIGPGIEAGGSGAEAAGVQ